MKHSELRKGNYVMEEDGSIRTITRISTQCEPAGQWPTVGIDGIFHYPQYLKPVPLNKEWLSKLGFSIEREWNSKFGSDFFRPDRKVVVSMSNHFGITISLADDRNSCKYMIDSVHELQNIYKDLTGESI